MSLLTPFMKRPSPRSSHWLTIAQTTSSPEWSGPWVAFVASTMSACIFLTVNGVRVLLYQDQPQAAWDFVERHWPGLVAAGNFEMEMLGGLLRFARLCAAVALANRLGAQDDHFELLVGATRDEAGHLKRSRRTSRHRFCTVSRSGDRRARWKSRAMRRAARRSGRRVRACRHAAYGGRDPVTARFAHRRPAAAFRDRRAVASRSRHRAARQIRSAP